MLGEIISEPDLMDQDQIPLGSPDDQAGFILASPFKTPMGDSAIIGQEFP